MPIVVRPAEGDSLTQGDILRGLSFATATADDKLQADARARYLLIVSRPCKSLRDPFVIVAPVIESKLDLAQLRQQLEGKGEKVTLDRMRRFLAGIRDGVQHPDSFYLGDLEEGTGKRFAADLSAFSTLQVPSDSTLRTTWINQHRIWRLDIEFARDLHLRVFNGVARLGFDDHAWFADPDLEIMITEGRKEVSVLQIAVADAERAVQTKEANNDTVSKKMLEEVESRRRDLKEAEDQLAPYLAERERRISRRAIANL